MRASGGSAMPSEESCGPNLLFSRMSSNSTRSAKYQKFMSSPPFFRCCGMLKAASSRPELSQGLGVRDGSRGWPLGAATQSNVTARPLCANVLSNCSADLGKWNSLVSKMATSACKPRKIGAVNKAFSIVLLASGSSRTSGDASAPARSSNNRCIMAASVSPTPAGSPPVTMIGAKVRRCRSSARSSLFNSVSDAEPSGCKFWPRVMIGALRDPT
mmetsp:Transcript_27224/g.76142  ORF Transcript_27224/g.76142 Transcript_27224/m.76142 type:complete len:215 (-) Transcript_27224:132-776(-)